jgi:transcriptional regulator with XRE-family HTH domain
MSGDTLGDRVRFLRKLAAMSARELDRLARLREGHIFQLESRVSGSERLEARTLNRIAEVFGVPMEWVFKGRGQRPNKMTVSLPVARARRAAMRENTTRHKTGTSD